MLLAAGAWPSKRAQGRMSRFVSRLHLIQPFILVKAVIDDEVSVCLLPLYYFICLLCKAYETRK